MGKWCRSPAIFDAISLLFIAVDNISLRASGYYPSDKIKERIAFALIHARVYLAESDDERDDKSAATNTFDISSGGGGSRY